MRRALIVWGGWEGHDPENVATVFRDLLAENGFEVTLADSLEAFNDAEKLKLLDLIVPVWTGGQITAEQLSAVTEAVGSGTGLAGCHGGMCDAFRSSPQWQFLTGGNWVAHPGGGDVTYTVNICNSSSTIVQGIGDFEVTSEQYYLHVDPAVEVLATTRFPAPETTGWHTTNGAVDVPVVWTKRWGKGRVFYISLGHDASIVSMKPVLEIARRGFLWAAEGKQRTE